MCPVSRDRNLCISAHSTRMIFHRTSQTSFQPTAINKFNTSCLLLCSTIFRTVFGWCLDSTSICDVVSGWLVPTQLMGGSRIKMGPGSITWVGVGAHVHSQKMSIVKEMLSNVSQMWISTKLRHSIGILSQDPLEVPTSIFPAERLWVSMMLIVISQFASWRPKRLFCVCVKG